MNGDQSRLSAGHEPPETEIVHTVRVSCEGGGVLGHPRVWYSIPEDKGWVECGYCDKKFILAGSAADTEDKRS
ncbi:MAG: zinc-finger domain-containing protein [Rhodobacteraceae bacterium]|nr:zinc-finger domain-containing protein [Paracoccaceae bacterium]